MRFATLLHFVELLQVEFLIFNGAPIIFGVVHGKAWSQCPIGADNQPVLAAAAAPVFAVSAHEFLHLLQPGDGINHFVALALLVDEPVEEIIHDGKILGPYIGIVPMQMLEMRLFHHGSFVHVKGDGDAVIVGNFNNLFHIFDICPADVGIEE